ncbi:DUF982 domain-containing protein [Ensifer soli]|uniref:DUF982 domain-containing protein n=1 Tax=Ciceribacter sp. sgz301302 TaxID=3342379 RepID=UPI0035BAD7A5
MSFKTAFFKSCRAFGGLARRWQEFRHGKGTFSSPTGSGSQEDNTMYPEEEPKKPAEIRWLIPVEIETGRHMRRVVHGPMEALNCLVQQWPQREGSHYLNAKQRCIDSMNRVCSAELAREAFINASLEALVAIRPVRPPQADNTAADGGSTA